MEYVKISREITVGLQPSEEDMKKLKKKGIKTLVNLSKKGELGVKFSPEEEEVKAKECGLEFVHFPISLSSLKSTHIDEFLSELKGAEGPFYIHCRIGQRSQPFGMIYHAVSKGWSKKKVEERIEKLGIKPDAPFIYDFMMNYVDKAHGAEA